MIRIIASNCLSSHPPQLTRFRGSSSVFLAGLVVLGGLLAIPFPQVSADDGSSAEPLLVHYRGELQQKNRGEDDLTVKRYTLTGLIVPSDSGKTLSWSVEEDGGRSWPWMESFGRLPLGGENTPNPSGPALLHEFNDLDYPVNLSLPIVPYANRLAEDASWQSDGFRYSVTGREQMGERECWKVEVAGVIGSISKNWIEVNSGLLVRTSRRVILGRGDPFQLVQELSETEQLSDEQAGKLSEGFDRLLLLKPDNPRKDRRTDGSLNRTEIAAITAELPATTEAVAESEWKSLLDRITHSVEVQELRQSGVEGLRKIYLGSEVKPSTLTELSGKPIEAEDWLGGGQITLLHLWHYRSEPLKEPYGQVGFLDFLINRAEKRKFGLRVYGVAVDPRFGDPAQADKARRGAEKLREFFRLSYPIVRDDGALLKTFGDPQRVGAELPLWILIDGEGKIRHYHAGPHRVDRNRGLIELDEAVIELVRSRREQAGQSE